MSKRQVGQYEFGKHTSQSNTKHLVYFFLQEGLPKTFIRNGNVFK